MIVLVLDGVQNGDCILDTTQDIQFKKTKMSELQNDLFDAKMFALTSETIKLTEFSR